MASHELGPDGFPVVHDEAGNSPDWLATVGFALVTLLAGYGAYRMMHPTEPEAAHAEAAAAEGDAADHAPEAEPAHDGDAKPGTGHRPVAIEGAPQELE
ncbi:MAG: hypothetical protein KC417_10835 [Myxococcales bacterium]|nr:hypothetical protein [Myxococcales bacterium]